MDKYVIQFEYEDGDFGELFVYSKEELNEMINDLSGYEEVISIKFNKIYE